MRLVIDANVIFSAFIKKGLTRRLILYNLFEMYTPRFVIEEFFEHLEELVNKTEVNKESIKIKIKEFILNSNIILASKKEIEMYIDEAKKISPDIDDVMYFALALKLNCPIWSNDEKLKEQNNVKIYSTSEILNILRQTE